MHTKISIVCTAIKRWLRAVPSVSHTKISGAHTGIKCRLRALLKDIQKISGEHTKKKNNGYLVFGLQSNIYWYKGMVYFVKTT